MINIEELVPGDTIWLSNISFSRSGRCTGNNFIEFTVTEDMRLKVVKIEEGSYSYNPGRVVDFSYFTVYQLFKTREEAIEDRNRSVRNTMDRLTSMYEQAMKRLKKKLWQE